jgi:tetratricopeptide (TPR) repeat protein
MDEAVALDEANGNASLAASFRRGRRAAMSAVQREAAPWDEALAALQAEQARHVAEAPATRDEAFLTMGLARLQSRRGEGEAALATARAGLARCTAPEEHCLWMRQVEGDVLWNMGRAEESLQAYAALQDALASGAYYEPGGRASADVAYARALASTGHANEALALLEAFFERHQAVHDGPTRTSIHALRLLSQLRQRNGDRAGALEAADDEVAQATALMGASSFDALGARIARARLLQAAGRLDEALGEVDAALPGFIEITGPASAHALQARGQRADLLMALGRADEALPVLREVVAGLTAGVGPQALQTLRQRVLLARALLASGDAPAARAEFDALVEAFGALGRDADARSVAAERDEIGVD